MNDNWRQKLCGIFITSSIVRKRRFFRQITGSDGSNVLEDGTDGQTISELIKPNLVRTRSDATSSPNTRTLEGDEHGDLWSERWREWGGWREETETTIATVRVGRRRGDEAPRVATAVTDIPDQHVSTTSSAPCASCTTQTYQFQNQVKATTNMTHNRFDNKVDTDLVRTYYARTVNRHMNDITMTVSNRGWQTTNKHRLPTSTGTIGRRKN